MLSSNFYMASHLNGGMESKIESFIRFCEILPPNRNYGFKTWDILRARCLIFRQYPQYISGNYIYHNRGMCSSKYFLMLFRSVDVIQHGRRVLNKCCSTSSVASCGSGLLFHGLWWKARTVTGLYDVTDVTVVYVTGYISATNSVDIAQRKRICRYMYVVFLLMQKY